MQIKIKMRFKNPICYKLVNLHETLGSIIKEALKRGNEIRYNYIYKDHYRPFNFSFFIPGLKENDVIDFFYINLSSTDNSLGIDFISGFNLISNKNSYKIYDQEIYTESVLISNKPELEDTEQIFRVKSLMLKERNYKGFKNTTLFPKEDNYEELENLIKSSIIKRASKSNIEVNNLIVKILNYKVYNQKYKNTDMKIFNCTLLVNSDKEVINMIYNLGLGSGRGMGFGWVEV